MKIVIVITTITRNPLHLSFGQRGITPTKATYQCPFEASCIDGIKSKGNYWGLANRTGGITFFPCPPLYCCTSLKDCLSFDTCYSNRRGRLCGDCIQNHSISLFGSNKCVDSRHCDNKVFWVFYLLLIIIFISALLYREEIVHKLKHWMSAIKKCWKRCTGGSNQLQDENHPYELCLNNQKSQNNGQESNNVSGVIKIAFFFYQTASILRINTSAKSNYKLPFLIDLFTSLFNVKMSSVSSDSVQICPFQTSNVVLVELFRISIILVALGTLLIGSLVIHVFGKRHKSKSDTEEREEQDNRDLNHESFKKTMSYRLKGSCVQLFLIGYASIATFCVSAVHCIKFEDGNLYLFIQAETVQCYQQWQIIIFVFIGSWLLPFPIALYRGCVLLRSRQITPNQFLMILTF